MPKAGRFIRQLHRNQSGNVMYLTAGLLMPIFAVIGAGVDLGQAYMAKTRLQQACDAGVLAGRRAMADGTYSSAAQTAANNMFAFNFPDDLYSSTGVDFDSEQRGASEVTATATATVNTMMMRMFGKEQIGITVNCTARLEVSNADIMFVLDTTGSMLETNSGDSVNKITALRTEVMNFFDTVTAAQSGTSILRFGVVPYSSNVNVGAALVNANPDWVSDTTEQHSRTATWVTTSSSGPTTTWSDVSGFSSWSNTGVIVGISSSYCNSTTRYPTYEDGSVVSGPTTSTSTSGTNPRTTTTYVDTNYNSTKYRYRWSSSKCREQRSTGVRRERVTSSITQTLTYHHMLRSFDVSAYKLAGGTITDPLGTNGANVTVSWNGCIIERDTNAFDDAASPPANTYDLDIDLVPNSEETRWHAAIRDFAFPRTSSPSSSQSPSPATMDTTTDIPSYGSSSNVSSGWSACPSPVMKLTPMTSADRSTLQTYVNNLVATGGTYHDVGMVWGARLASPTGLFASENATASNGMAISRHIIFMTDGQMAPNPGIFGFQGEEYLDGRVGSTSTSEMTARHNKRFLTACDAAKSHNITVWVVSFGTSLSSDMRACASGDRAFQANNSSQLRQQFQAIASQITRLRLSE
ncbi:MAG: Tad domain-containing protein [Sphingomonadaceae bacterium]|nr:Tad domain-containing protein [Sphingomonadaceae bacterium]